LLLISMPEQQNFAALAEKIQNDTEKDFKIQVCDPDDTDDLYLSVRYENQIYDLHIIPKPEEVPPVYAKSSYDMTEEQLQVVLESPVQYLLVTEIPSDAQTAYHIYMEIISILFPELIGVVNLLAQKAYPPKFVKFAGKFAHAVVPYDVFGISITGTEDGSDIFMSTIGLCTLGMRELELIGANADNFGYFANMLDYTAAMCVQNDHLPDAGNILSSFSENELEYQLTWQSPAKILPDLPQDCIAVQMQREVPSAILILTETKNSPAINPIFEDLDALHYGNTARNFHRRIELAKETFPVFQKALEHGFEKAAVRLELDLDDYGYYESEAYLYGDEDDEPDYSVELVWADVKQEQNTIKANISEEFPTLPYCHAGDEIAFTQENIASWAIILPDDDEAITQEET
ncbi:MAG: hypothetical protein K2H89_09755, partial [Oscillospiraceae bacterium]|nr:hypothetical protein [Oscillospiraceae bacterium]